MFQAFENWRWKREHELGWPAKSEKSWKRNADRVTNDFDSASMKPSVGFPECFFDPTSHRYSYTLRCWGLLFEQPDARGCCLAYSPDANDANFPCKSRHISPNTEVAHAFPHLLTLSFPCSAFSQVHGLISLRYEYASDKKFFHHYPEEGRESIMSRYAEYLSSTNRKYRVIGTVIPKGQQRQIVKHSVQVLSPFLRAISSYFPGIVSTRERAASIGRTLHRSTWIFYKCIEQPYRWIETSRLTSNIFVDDRLVRSNRNLFISE